MKKSLAWAIIQLLACFIGLYVLGVVLVIGIDLLTLHYIGVIMIVPNWFAPIEIVLAFGGFQLTYLYIRRQTSTS